MFIASNIKYLRAQKGLTQSQLAKKLEKTSAAVSDYEKGKSIPPLDVVYRMCEFFEVNIDHLVRTDLQKEDILSKEGLSNSSPSKLKSDYKKLQQDLQTLQRLARLQDQRLAELEREIREHAPELARRLGL